MRILYVLTAQTSTAKTKNFRPDENQFGNFLFLHPFAFLLALSLLQGLDKPPRAP